MDWLRNLFTPKPPKEWKYVGRTMSAWHRQIDGGKPYDIGSATVMYYMTDDGDRKYEIVYTGQVTEKTLNNGRDKSNQLMNADVWRKGGPFPDNFQSETDVLGEMLNRLVNEKLGVTGTGGGDK